MFDAYFKGQGSDLNGRGLGLTLCKHICNKMNGDINIESNVKTGTSVTVNIPVSLNPNSNIQDMSTNQDSFQLSYYDYLMVNSSLLRLRENRSQLNFLSIVNDEHRESNESLSSGLLI